MGTYGNDFEENQSIVDTIVQQRDTVQNLHLKDAMSKQGI